MLMNRKVMVAILGLRDKRCFEDGNVVEDQDRWKWRAGKMAMTRQRLTNMFDGS